MPASQDAIDADLRLLESTADGAARNALALRLAELKTPGLPEVLIRLINRADLVENRGPLVHSLSYFDCSRHVGVLVGLVADGDRDVAHEALEALETVSHAGGDDVEAAFAKAKAAHKKVDQETWRRAILDDLFEMFD